MEANWYRSNFREIIMKKLLLLCLLPFYLQGACLWPELKVSYFRFQSNELRRVYGSGAPFIQGEINYNVTNQVLVFGDVGYLWKNSNSRDFHGRTRIEIFPWTLGAKWFYPFNFGSVYLGGGFRTSTVSIHNHCRDVDSNSHRTELGGVFNGGANVCWQRFVFNPFVEYNFNRMRLRGRRENVVSHHLDIGGFAFGAGLGYAY